MTEHTESVFPIEQQTVGRVLAHQARKFGDKAMTIGTNGDTATYRELDEVSNRIAHGAASLGIENQVPVLAMLPDVVDYMRLWCGLAKRGAIEVPVNPAYRGGILTHICNDSTARTIVIDRQYLERLEDICDDLKYLERCILYSEDPAERENLELPPKLAQRCTAESFSSLLSQDTSPFEPAPEFHDLTLIIYTSGTTGPSKGVMITHAHAFTDGNACAREVFYLTPEDVIYTAGMPLFHVGGKVESVYAAMIAGASAVLPRGYKNQLFWPDIERHGCTVAGLLGAIGNFLWQQPESPDDANTPLQRVAMLPLIPEYEDFGKRFGVEIFSCYGSTESPTPILLPKGEPIPSIRCIGRARKGVLVKIFDDHDRELPIGELGEICVRPMHNWGLMTGYWQRPDATAEAFRNLWYHTGDSGYQDEEGRFYFVDRKTDSMRRRGENISSMEVEDEINSHPQVLESAAFPVWAEESEQEVMATISAKPGETIDPVELTQYLNQRMPYFMVPRYIDFADELAKTPSGKIQKFPLRQKGISETTWDRVAAGIKLER